MRYKSSSMWLEMPVVAIAVGPDAASNEVRGHARGIIAIGDIATGVVAMGGLARGVVALGGLAIGGIALGGAAFGLLGLGGLRSGAWLREAPLSGMLPLAAWRSAITRPAEPCLESSSWGRCGRIPKRLSSFQDCCMGCSGNLA